MCFNHTFFAAPKESIAKKGRYPRYETSSFKRGAVVILDDRITMLFEFSEGLRLKLYPINLDIDGKPCVVIGGGEVALRKIRGLLAAGAKVKVIAPEVCAEVEELARRGEISLTWEKFSADILGDELILIAATDNPEVNRRAASQAKNLVNVVEGTGGNFNVPSTIRRGELLLTVSTGANSPAFSKFIRQMLEAELGENFDAGLEIISRRRRELKRLLPNHKQRKIFWQKVLTQETWQLLKNGQLDELEDKINYAFESFGLESPHGTH